MYKLENVKIALFSFCTKQGFSGDVCFKNANCMWAPTPGGNVIFTSTRAQGRKGVQIPGLSILQCPLLPICMARKTMFPLCVHKNALEQLSYRHLCNSGNCLVPSKYQPYGPIKLYLMREVNVQFSIKMIQMHFYLHTGHTTACVIITYNSNKRPK